MIKTNKRIWELDFIRGCCVLLMVLDHTLFDLGMVFFSQWFPAGGSGLLHTLCHFAANFYWMHPLRSIIQPSIVMIFILICGISCGFSRSNLRRGLKLLGIALLLTTATYALDRLMGYTDFFIIRFGILHMLAFSILLFAGLRRCGRWLTFICGLLLAALGLWFGANPIANSGLIPYILGIGSGSYSSDYFPLLPWVGYFLIGGALTALLYRKRISFFPNHGEGRALKPFMWLGKHALWIYVLHQPIIYGLLYVIGLLAV